MIPRPASLVFDCDGVVLDSNRLKTHAFHAVASRFGEAPARQLVDFHVRNGGISRYRKFHYFLETILGGAADAASVDTLAAEYGRQVRERLMDCELSPGLHCLREATPDCRWMIVSGGDQSELRDVFARRGIAEWFDGGIYGSPAAKDAILADIQGRGMLPAPSLFIGDSAYDYQCAAAAGLGFVFVSAWSELVDWECFCADRGIPAVRHAADVAALLEPL